MDAKIREMNEQRANAGGKTGSCQTRQMAVRVSWTEEFKTSLMKHEHVKAEKVGPGAVATLTLWYTHFL